MGMSNNKGIDDSEENVHTEVYMIPICTLKLQVHICSSHKKCFKKIVHVETCTEPFICEGNVPCLLTCQTNLKNDKKQEKRNQEKFWKSVTAELFPIDNIKCDASTMAESYNQEIQTYLHVRESYFQTRYNSLHEMLKFELQPPSHRTECLNRLRRKVSTKNPDTFSFNPNSLRQSLYRESLYDNAVIKMDKIKEHYCKSKGHDIKECKMQCFKLLTNSVAVSTHTAFGSVVSLSKSYTAVPRKLIRIVSNIDVSADLNKGKGKIGNKDSKIPKMKSNNSVNTGLISSSKQSINIHPDKNKSNDEKKNAVDFKDVNGDDDEIEELLKIIGIGQSDENLVQAVGNICEDTGEIKSNDVAVESKDTRTLKVCFYCKKKETQPKMFKKCSRCKEEKFPVQHYYCSKECLLEDWAEKHEEEHIKFKKQ